MKKGRGYGLAGPGCRPGSACVRNQQGIESDMLRQVIGYVEAGFFVCVAARGVSDDAADVTTDIC